MRRPADASRWPRRAWLAQCCRALFTMRSRAVLRCLSHAGSCRWVPGAAGAGGWGLFGCVEPELSGRDPYGAKGGG